MSEPLSHLSRPCPPWRLPDRTECGRPLSDVARFVSRDEARGMVARYGKQRAAFLLCMTCAQTMARYATWEQSPSSVIGRETDDVRYRRDGPAARIDQELAAIAALIEAHRDEFDAYLAGLGETVSLQERRASRRR